MPVKLLMTWDIRSGREQDYFEFVVREFIPGMQKLGLEPSDAWFTMYGGHPQIMTGVISPTQTALKSILDSAEWEKLTAQLHDFVENFTFKVVPARRGFQL